MCLASWNGYDKTYNASPPPFIFLDMVEMKLCYHSRVPLIACNESGNYKLQGSNVDRASLEKEIAKGVNISENFEICGFHHSLKVIPKSANYFGGLKCLQKNFYKGCRESIFSSAKKRQSFYSFVNDMYTLYHRI